MTEFTIVTPADAGYFALLQALLSPLSPFGNVPICVLDLGLQKDQREELHDRGPVIFATMHHGDWRHRVRNPESLA
jgi:hypothetical protein